MFTCCKKGAKKVTDEGKNDHCDIVTVHLPVKDLNVDPL